MFLLACEPQPAVVEVKKKLAVPNLEDIPDDTFGQMVRYGRELFLRTAYYIGPDGVAGSYLGNKMNCTNCHQDAGTKPYAFNLMRSHERYPSYRAREGKVLTLADRVNNCIMRPHSGRPLPYESREMTAFLSYLKWINTYLTDSTAPGEKALAIEFPDRAADPEKGAKLYSVHCSRCHGDDGQGIMDSVNIAYKYPPLWGKYGYQPGSSMHRVIMQAQWLKANMPYDRATHENPVLTDEEALDIAAFVNNDEIHPRPEPEGYDYPNPGQKPIDFGKGPYLDTFSATQHKYGPFKPIIAYWKDRK